MSKLISKKQAATAFIDGEDVEFMDQTGQWRTILDNTVLKVFLDRTHFRLKPRPININGIEVPAPFEPKEGDTFWRIYPSHSTGYHAEVMQGTKHDELYSQFGAWRTEEEIEKVVAALRSIFNPQ